VAVDILNTNPASVTVDIRVDDDFSADGAKHCQNTLVDPLLRLQAPKLLFVP
jgi:hypothetical protein